VRTYGGCEKKRGRDDFRWEENACIEVGTQPVEGRGKKKKRRKKPFFRTYAGGSDGLKGRREGRREGRLYKSRQRKKAFISWRADAGRVLTEYPWEGEEKPRRHEGGKRAIYRPVAQERY